MKKKYNKEEKDLIVEEAIQSKNKGEIAKKYDIHLATLYVWIAKKNPESKTDFIGFKVTEKEKKIIYDRIGKLGYGNDISTYMRKIIFSKEILVGDPQEVREELYRTRGELNKIGSNINQIANYTNYLWKNKYVENSFSDEIIKQTSLLLEVCLDQKTVIDKSLRRIFN
ncbi:transposase-like protein [Gillisia mitskevichiae]|uniref:Transposase-like protein n=1 Tax=Gillisia mitskevichiae TaxID=270921 RepID=A0A495PTI8_9FLAO|nr:plasmid mobilization relaxosome protein MobC [Gillisia mitskevichiae]RKS53914.1 transposase-like protein [Gillisia mitskevichiae]